MRQATFDQHGHALADKTVHLGRGALRGADLVEHQPAGFSQVGGEAIRASLDRPPTYARAIGFDARRQVLYAGHFGFVNRTGQRVGRFPLFRTQYRDHESAWRAGAAWPKDAALRNYHLGDDDTVPWITSTGGRACWLAGWCSWRSSRYPCV